MLVEYGFGMLPLQLYLITKGAGIMFIIEITDGFRCCPIYRLDIRPEIGHFLEECVSIFNVLGLLEVLFFLMVLPIADITALSSQQFWRCQIQLQKLLHPLN